MQREFAAVHAEEVIREAQRGIRVRCLVLTALSVSLVMLALFARLAGESPAFPLLMTFLVSAGVIYRLFDARKALGQPLAKPQSREEYVESLRLVMAVGNHGARDKWSVIGLFIVTGLGLIGILLFLWVGGQHATNHEPFGGRVAGITVPLIMAFFLFDMWHGVVARVPDLRRERMHARLRHAPPPEPAGCAAEGGGSSCTGAGALPGKP